MPQSEYYGGHGKKVMAAMRERYGEKKGKQVFYATANKRDDPAMKILSTPKKKK